MNTDYLAEFIAFSETLNYAKTAKDLYISQPSLIQHIKRLEEDIGTDLVLHRGKAKKPALTLAGTVLAYSAQEIIDACNKVAASCRQASLKEADCIAIQDSRHSLSIPPAFWEALKDSWEGRAIRFKNPLRFAEKKWFETLEGEDSVDIAFCPFFKGEKFEDIKSQANDEFGFVTLPREECFLLVSADHPFASRKAVSVRDLAGHRLTLADYHPWQPFFDALVDDVKSLVPDLRIAYFTPNDASQDPLNISHENISIHPKASADAAVAHWDGGLVALPLSDYDAYSIPVAIYRKDNPKRALHEFFERIGNAWE